MNRTQAILSKALVLVLPIAVSAAVVAPGEARAQEDSAPPAAYIATTTPEFFEGRPVYYWNNYWYYRDGPRWNVYRDEPLTLRGLRANWSYRPRYHYHR